MSLDALLPVLPAGYTRTNNGIAYYHNNAEIAFVQVRNDGYLVHIGRMIYFTDNASRVPLFLEDIREELGEFKEN